MLRGLFSLQRKMDQLLEKEQIANLKAEEAVRLWIGKMAPNSQRTYHRVFNQWIGFLDCHFLEASSLHVDQYFKRRMKAEGDDPRDMRGTKKLAGKTISTEFGALKGIYNFLDASPYEMRMNPIRNMRCPMDATSNVKRATEMLDYEQVTLLLNHPSVHTPEGIRDRAMFALFFGAALRISEVHGLRVGDIAKSPKGTLFVILRQTKNGKPADQSIMHWARGAIETYVEQRLNEGASHHEPLFVQYNRKGPTKPSSCKTIYRRFKEHCAACGVSDNISPHSARATAITSAFDSDVEPRKVQHWARHANLKTTEQYFKRTITVDESPVLNVDYKKLTQAK